MSSLRKYIVVKFTDGLQIVPINWKINNQTFYYPVGLNNSKLYDDLVLKMVDPTDNSKINHKFVWSKLTIIKIYGSDDDFINAKQKLKNAENYSNSNTDDDNIKTQRHKHAKKRYSSEEEHNEISFFNVPLKNISNVKKNKPNNYDTSIFNSFPIAPDTLNQFIDQQYNMLPMHTMVTNPTVISDTNINNLVSTEQLFFDELNDNNQFISSTQIERPKTPIQTTNASNMLRNALDMSFMINSVNNEIDEEFDSLNKQVSYINNNSTNKFMTTNELDKKVEKLVNDTTEIKFKVDEILLNQERILNYLRHQQCYEPNNSPSEEFDLHFQNYYPLNESKDILHVMELLKNENYYKLLKSKLLTYGGTDISNATKIILTKLLSNQLGTKITLTGLSTGRRRGPEEKLGFLKTKLFGLLIDVLKISFPNTTEELVKKLIRSWLKHAKDRLSREKKCRQMYRHIVDDNSDTSY